MTTRIYDTDSYCKSFTATVISCRSLGELFEVELDCTAFYPEGGGQYSDTGFINGIKVTDVQDKNGIILHQCDGELVEGSTVDGSIDWEQRFARMQNHSGEHIISGLAHNLFGANNVGFHMSKAAMTVDLDICLSDSQLDELERRANQCVYLNLPISARYLSSNEIHTLDYRSKLDLSENVRLVTIENVDACACCAPHVHFTGEIGQILVLSAQHYKGGTRIELLCAEDARNAAKQRLNACRDSAVLLSSLPEALPASVSRLLQENEHLQRRCTELLTAYAEQLATEASKHRLGVIFDKMLDEQAMRFAANRLASLGCLIGAVFQGDDTSGYRFILRSDSIDLNEYKQELMSGIKGRGGGTKLMLRGTAMADRTAITEYLDSFAGLH